MNTYVFIDASNLFYGGEKSLGWKIDYRKLSEYLQSKYSATQIFYFGGVETHGLEYDYQKEDSVPLEKLHEHLIHILSKNRSKDVQNIEFSSLLIARHLRSVRFYLKLSGFGYRLHLKPVKFYSQADGEIKRKANCDVDMTFHLMKELDNFNRTIILSGDGDFLPVLKHIRGLGKEIIILSRSKRTAKEIKRFAGSNFRDFEYLREKISAH
jgi:uncharacterized LabA/DUF88 family protein